MEARDEGDGNIATGLHVMMIRNPFQDGKITTRFPMSLVAYLTFNGAAPGGLHTVKKQALGYV